jgi:hypothetical protein
MGGINQKKEKMPSTDHSSDGDPASRTANMPSFPGSYKLVAATSHKSQQKCSFIYLCHAKEPNHSFDKQPTMHVTDVHLEYIPGNDAKDHHRTSQTN